MKKNTFPFSVSPPAQGIFSLERLQQEHLKSQWKFSDELLFCSEAQVILSIYPDYI